VKKTQNIVLVPLSLSLLSLCFSVVIGLLSAFFYANWSSPILESIGISLQTLRPLHTSFAIAWIFFAAVALMYHFIINHYGGNLSRSDRIRFNLHTFLWAFSGVGIIVSLFSGLSSGREYFGYHPSYSVLIYIGWILFAYNFLKAVAKDFWNKPVYVYMWTFATVLFLYVFLEAHAWLIPGIAKYPIVDLQLQWKSIGSFVGVFNHLVYGSLLYVGEKLSGDKKLAQSRTAFLLFGIGALNSVTNYAHHTYHLPQSELVKWISFLVSMLEIIIFVKVATEMASKIKCSQTQKEKDDPACFFIFHAKTWSFINLLTALLISIPPLNAVIHGTHVVFAHAMGSMIGVDSFILLGTIAWLMSQYFPGIQPKPKLFKIPGRILSVSLFLMVMGMSAIGISIGVHRYNEIAPPGWTSELTSFTFPVLGGLMALAILQIVSHWLAIIFRLWPQLTSFHKRVPSTKSGSRRII
jgi:nitric oxide reductase subunit B